MRKQAILSSLTFATFALRLQSSPHLFSLQIIFTSFQRHHFQQTWETPFTTEGNTSSFQLNWWLSVFGN